VKKHASIKAPAKDDEDNENGNNDDCDNGNGDESTALVANANHEKRFMIEYFGSHNCSIHNFRSAEEQVLYNTFANLLRNVWVFANLKEENFVKLSRCFVRREIVIGGSVVSAGSDGTEKLNTDAPIMQSMQLASTSDAAAPEKKKVARRTVAKMTGNTGAADNLNSVNSTLNLSIIVVPETSNLKVMNHDDHSSEVDIHHIS
jgi:hypothetical protein